MLYIAQYFIHHIDTLNIVYCLQCTVPARPWTHWKQELHLVHFYISRSSNASSQQSPTTNMMDHLQKKKKKSRHLVTNFKVQVMIQWHLQGNWLVPYTQGMKIRTCKCKSSAISYISIYHLKKKWGNNMTSPELM